MFEDLLYFSYKIYSTNVLQNELTEKRFADNLCSFKETLNSYLLFQR